VEGESAGFHQPNQERARNAQYVGSSLCVEWPIFFAHDGKHLVELQTPKNRDQQILHLLGNVGLVPVCSDEFGATLPEHASKNRVWVDLGVTD